MAGLIVALVIVYLLILIAGFRAFTRIEDQNDEDKEAQQWEDQREAMYDAWKRKQNEKEK